jgi:hypothetical protein
VYSLFYRKNPNDEQEDACAVFDCLSSLTFAKSLLIEASTIIRCYVDSTGEMNDEDRAYCQTQREAMREFVEKLRTSNARVRFRSGVRAIRYEKKREEAEEKPQVDKTQSALNPIWISRRDGLNDSNHFDSDKRYAGPMRTDRNRTFEDRMPYTRTSNYRGPIPDRNRDKSSFYGVHPRYPSENVDESFQPHCDSYRPSTENHRPFRPPFRVYENNATTGDRSNAEQSIESRFVRGNESSVAEERRRRFNWSPRNPAPEADTYRTSTSKPNETEEDEDAEIEEEESEERDRT